MSHRDRIHDLIRSTQNQERAIWRTAVSHSDAYMKTLGLSEASLEILERSQERAGMYPTLEDHQQHSSLQLEVEEETFFLYVKNVCGAPYGASWQMCMLAACASNPDVNLETGQGTTHIVAVTEEWHQKLLRVLSK
jgi:hypothetical protein